MKENLFCCYCQSMNFWYLWKNNILSRVYLVDCIIILFEADTSKYHVWLIILWLYCGQNAIKHWLNAVCEQVCGAQVCGWIEMIYVAVFSLLLQNSGTLTFKLKVVIKLFLLEFLEYFKFYSFVLMVSQKYTST